jgi:hypothetical protein
MVKLSLCLVMRDARNIYIYIFFLQVDYKSIISWSQHYILCSVEGFWVPASFSVEYSSTLIDWHNMVKNK